MKFYIVTPPIKLVEEDRGFIGDWFPSFFNLLNASTELPMKNRQITPALVKEHLQDSKCWDRRRFDSIEEAQYFVREMGCGENEAVPVYQCSIPTEPDGTRILGKPSNLPSNSVFLSIDDFTIEKVSLFNKNNQIISNLEFPSTSTQVYRR